MPVVYRRPVLRAFFALFVVALVVWDISMVWYPPEADPLLASDWWLGPVMFAMFGGCYLYASSSLRVTATHVELFNPFRRVAIPLGVITGATAGANLRIETNYGRFYAWGVEAANVQVATDDFGTQDDLVALIERAAAQAPAHDGPTVRYRFNWPDALFLLAGAVMVIDAYVLATTGPGA